jgi:hypothetical protein
MKRLLLLSVLLAAAPAAAQVHSGSIVLNGRAVPLPPGDWQVIGASQSATTAVGDATVLGLSTMLLAQEEGARLSALISIAAGARAQNARYDLDAVAGCRFPPQPIAVLARQADPTAQDCAHLREWRSTAAPPENPGARWAAYFEWASTRPGWAPALFHVAWFRIADRTGALDVVYAISPETRGFAPDQRDWPRNAWNTANQDAPRRAYLARLTTWARAVQPLVRQGFADGAVGPAGAP